MAARPGIAALLAGLLVGLGVAIELPAQQPDAAMANDPVVMVRERLGLLDALRGLPDERLSFLGERRSLPSNGADGPLLLDGDAPSRDETHRVVRHWREDSRRVELDAIAEALTDADPPLDLTERPPAAKIAGILTIAGYPMPWVAEEVAFWYGNDGLTEVIQTLAFLYGQSIKDLLRDALEEGARRRSEIIAEVRRKVPDQERGALGDVELSDVERIALDEQWQLIDWTLVSLGAMPLDLRFLLPNDDPGGLTAGEQRGPLASEQ